MRNNLRTGIIFIAAAISMVGCNVGNAPAGMSADEAKDHWASLPPEEQIKMIQSSPAPQPEKDAKIAEIRKKYNLPDPGPGASTPNGPPGLPPQAGS